nr:SWIM zinc finger domain-containing protein [Candidatus Methanoperedens sp.]
YISPKVMTMFDRSEEAEAVLHHTLRTEGAKRIAQPPEGSLMNNAIRLVFDATGSQDRMNRILRAYDEPYTWIHQDNGNWTCLNREGKAYRLYVDLERSLGYCSCQDFQQRGLAQKMPCKHLYGYVVQTQNNDFKKAKAEQEGL